MSFEMRTYKQEASEWYLEESAKGTVGAAQKAGAEIFAAYLDKKHLDSTLQVIALQQGREVDRQVMKALIDAIGQEKANEIIRPIIAQFGK